jgi:hypothetical protein
MANSKGITSLVKKRINPLVKKSKDGKRPGYNGVWDWVVEKAADAVGWYADNKDVIDTAVKGGSSAIKGYMDYKDAKRRNELEEKAYDDYMKEAEAAGYEAQAAIDLNLTPMTVSNLPTTKANITDYTAATGLKHGGISGLRKKYYEGTGETEVLEMDEEVITPYDLQKEEGVEIGEQVFYNTGQGDRANAWMIWDQMSTPDKSIFEFDFEMFFQDGGWRDMIKGEAPIAEENMMASNAENDQILEMLFEKYIDLGLSPADAEKKAREEFDRMSQAKEPNKQMASSPDDFMTEEEMQIPNEEIMAMIGAQQAAQGGVIGLRKGGRVKRNVGGIMDLGGMEKDYRFNGGFVPIGEYEKKDDVPARLSKNEFVFTADAVRAAGGGSINKGAKRMYDTMKNLEASPTAKRMTA